MIEEQIADNTRALRELAKVLSGLTVHLAAWGQSTTSPVSNQVTLDGGAYALDEKSLALKKQLDAVSVITVEKYDCGKGFPEPDKNTVMKLFQKIAVTVVNQARLIELMGKYGAAKFTLLADDKLPAFYQDMLGLAKELGI